MERGTEGRGMVREVSVKGEISEGVGVPAMRVFKRRAHASIYFTNRKLLLLNLNKLSIL